jgi:hypothetical protein
MPRAAIAVASGQVSLDLARELEGLGREAVAQALLALLRQQFAHLGEPGSVAPWDNHSGAQSPGIGIRPSNYGSTELAKILGLDEIQMLVHEEQGQATLVVYWSGGETTVSCPADGRAWQMKALREVIGQIQAQASAGF